jgi:enoyl-[acyl-carrier protein] reductase/trans-2-enoyl-CoA reductase (NAD+)
VVTQASAAIPVVPLYNTLLFSVMKDQGNHEDCIDHIYRFFVSSLYGTSPEVDEVGRLRLDGWELAPGVQDEVLRRWSVVDTENLDELGDLAGFRSDFLKLFGFGMEGVDYDADLDPRTSEL